MEYLGNILEQNVVLHEYGDTDPEKKLLSIEKQRKNPM